MGKLLQSVDVWRGGFSCWPYYIVLFSLILKKKKKIKTYIHFLLFVSDTCCSGGSLSGGGSGLSSCRYRLCVSIFPVYF